MLDEKLCDSHFLETCHDPEERPVSLTLPQGALACLRERLGRINVLPETVEVIIAETVRTVVASWICAVGEALSVVA